MVSNNDGQDKQINIDDLSCTEYSNRHSHFDEIWVFIMESAISFEEDRGLSRRELCEGLILATLDLIAKREDHPELTDVRDIHDFYGWVLKRTLKKTEELPSLEAIEKKEKSGERISRNATDYGWKPRPNPTEH